MKTNKLYLLILLSVAAIITSILFFRGSILRTRRAGLNENLADGKNYQNVGTLNVPSGPLKVQYASPPPKIAPEIPAPTPVPVHAVVRRNDKTYSPKFYAGHSERLAAALNERVPIQLSWPDETTHSDVFVQAVHGGKIDGAGNSKRFSLKETKTVSFTFTPDAGPGSYEIVMRRGTTEEALSFWVSTGNPHADPPAVKW
jgi:hypothetical protein